MSDFNFGAFIGALVVLIIWVVVLLIGGKFDYSNEQLIENGLAKYNANTGRIELILKDEVE